MLPQSKATPNETMNLLIHSLNPSQLPVFVVKMAWLLLTTITNESTMSVVYHNKPCETQVVFLFGRCLHVVIQGPRSSSVLWIWPPLSGAEPSSFIRRWERDGEAHVGGFHGPGLDGEHMASVYNLCSELNYMVHPIAREAGEVF